MAEKCAERGINKQYPLRVAVNDPKRLTYKMAKEMWPTPTTMDTLPARDPVKLEEENRVRGGRKNRLALSNLREAIHSPYYQKKFATPQSRDFRTGSQERYDDPARTKNLNDQIGGQLNPDWVEWLMGWPIGWTALEPITLLDWRDWSSDPGNQDGTRTINGGKERVARLKAIGNGQVPAVVQLAWKEIAI